MAAKWGGVAKSLRTHVFGKFVAMPNGRSDVSGSVSIEVQMLFYVICAQGLRLMG